MLMQKFKFVTKGTVVQTHSGPVKGYWKYTKSKRTRHYAFTGIPYAKPPVGKLRFQLPEWMNKSKTRINTIYSPSKCVQFDTRNDDDITGSEDCLHLNILTTALNYKLHLNGFKSIKQPVVVWIHGGFFFRGHAQRYNTHYFVEQNIVTVSINYRLGFMGFSQTKDVPNNLGLKDQVMALRWVQKNIEFFGGDPTRITIMGESAGAASVAYLIETPITRGLFQRAIMQSGNTFSKFSVARPISNLTKNMLKAYTWFMKLWRMAPRTGLTSLPTSVFSGLSSFFEIAQDPLRGLIFAPKMEEPSPTAVFTKETFHAVSTCKKGSLVPILAGFNAQEGRIFTTYTIVNKLLSKLYGILYNIIKSRMLPYGLGKLKECHSLGAEVQEHYEMRHTSQLAKLFGDLLFTLPTFMYVRQYSKCNDVYFYRFSYENATHGEDLKFLFPDHRFASKAKENVSTKMVQLWSNFIKFGNPTPDGSLVNGGWPKSTQQNKYAMLNIDTLFEIMDMDTNPHKPDVMFWEQLSETCLLNQVVTERTTRRQKWFSWI